MEHFTIKPPEERVQKTKIRKGKRKFLRDLKNLSHWWIKIKANQNETMLTFQFLQISFFFVVDHSLFALSNYPTWVYSLTILTFDLFQRFFNDSTE